jgi:two-component system OmpR family response regulator
VRILLVEDQNELARQVTQRLTWSGFAVDCVGTVKGAVDALDAYSYAITVLDRRLPDGDGLSIVPEIKRRHPDSRVLVLSALDALDDRIDGLDAGADDYLTKPFSLDEMMARIRACLRRGSRSGTPSIVIGALSFDVEARTVTVADAPVVLHRRELALLEALCRRSGRIVSRDALQSEIWSFDEEVQPHALTIIVSRLRARLDRLDAGVEIRSARGVGYLIAEAKA